MGALDAKTRYALLAALDLAEHSRPDRPSTIREVASRTGIPPKYLVHILLRLKRRALVNSTRGAKGGYWLLRPAELISMAEVIGAVSSAPRQAPASAGAHGAAIVRLWTEAERRRQELLARTSLADLLRT